MSDDLNTIGISDPQELAVIFDRAKEGDVDEELFISVLRESLDVVQQAGLPFVCVGGLASAALGRPRWTHDIDVFVKRDDADRALQAYADAGFLTQKTNSHWLYKAVKEGVLVDVLFRLTGDIYLDDEMLQRSVVKDVKGVPVRVASPEDLVVSKAVVSEEETARHWFDALGLLAECELDWDYLLRRARYGARRVLSLLVYADSNDLIVPADVISQLFETVYGREQR